jgi:hypothetical protein
MCYWVVAAAIMSIAFEDYLLRVGDRQYFMQSWPGFSLQMAVCCLYLAVGSFCFHASLSDAAHRTDLGGMFAVFSAPFSFSLFKFFTSTNYGSYLCGSKAPRAAPFLITPLLTLCVLQLLPIRIELPLGLLCLLGFLVLEFFVVPYARGTTKSRLQYYFLGGAMLFFSLGIVFSRLDISRTICIRDDHWFQGHALWHALTSASIACIYFLLRFDRSKPIHQQTNSSKISADTQAIQQAKKDMLTKANVHEGIQQQRENKQQLQQAGAIEIAKRAEVANV